MTKNRYYTGIDYFRIIAAFLIIAIHTSPLESFGGNGDFIFTRIIARIAVPFFFMTSGFFLITRYSCNAGKLVNFIKKTAVIYAVSILVYIPLNIYTGYFKMKYLMPNIIKDIIFDGTFYHLWYLPASIIGAVIAWFLVKRLDYTKALSVAALLYLIGLFGDSYYGTISGISGIKGFYALIFQISDYTRNGIFFAPVFFVLGGLIADGRRNMPSGSSATGFTVSFILMFAEAMTLHHFNLQRHDSMYVLLLPCTFFLFNALLNFRGKQRFGLRSLSLVIYIIHPMMIVAVRMAARLLHIEGLLIKNSMVHYLTVCFASVLFGLLTAFLLNRFKMQKTKHDKTTERAWIEINTANLDNNVRVLQRELPPKCRLMAVVKANAYGHGAFEICTHLNRKGIRAFAVATIDEGISLRKYGIRGNILILGYTNEKRALELKKYDLTQTLIDFDYAEKLNSQGIPVKVHIKIDTGMRRLGIPCKNLSEIKEIFDMENLNVCGIYTHLSRSDSLTHEDAAFTGMQIESFYSMINELKAAKITIPKLHIQSSYGLLNYNSQKCDYVRVGMALYGVLSSAKDTTLLKPNLRPVLSLKARVILIRSVKKGETVGYGKEYVAKRNTIVAILPIGYNDGLPRNLSCGDGNVLINKQQFPVIGRICMDQIAVDITDSDDVAVGDIATLISPETESRLSAPYVADSCKTISNELLCRLGERLPVTQTRNAFP